MDVRAEGQDLREIAVSISTTKSARSRKTRATSARDACGKRIVGKCTELLIIQSRMAQSIRILSIALDVSIKPCENVVEQAHGLTVTAHSSAPR
jgi:hypothetical protein